jgi:hypothetical protein
MTDTGLPLTMIFWSQRLPSWLWAKAVDEAAGQIRMS